MAEGTFRRGSVGFIAIALALGSALAGACGESRRTNDARANGSGGRGGDAGADGAGSGATTQGGRGGVGASAGTAGSGGDGGADDGGEAGTGAEAGQGGADAPGGSGGAGIGGAGFSGSGGFGGSSGCGVGGDAGGPGTGGSGIGGSGATEPVFVPRAPSNDCATVVGTPTGAVAFDATVTCAAFSSIQGIAPSNDARAYLFVAVRSIAPISTRFVTFEEPSTVTVETGPPRATPSIATDPSGAPFLFGAGFASGLHFYRVDQQGFWPEPVALASASRGAVPLTSARFGSDGRAHFVFRAGYCGVPTRTWLATRSAAGAWTDTVFAWEGVMRLVVDSRDRPHVVFVDQRVVSDWLQGSNIPTMFGSAPNFTGILAGAPVGDGEVAVLAQLEDAIHVFAPDGSGVVRDRVLSSTGLPRLSGCPDLPSLSEVEMPRTPCTNTSEGAIDAGLASTADGSLWTVYRFERIERDMVQFCTPENGLISCGQELVAERSSAELVVAHLPPDGTSPVTIRWRTPIALNTTGLTVESRGSRLSVAYASFVPGSDRWAIRYVNLDTANL